AGLRRRQLARTAAVAGQIGEQQGRYQIGPVLGAASRLIAVNVLKARLLTRSRHNPSRAASRAANEGTVEASWAEIEIDCSLFGNEGSSDALDHPLVHAANAHAILAHEGPVHRIWIDAAGIGARARARGIANVVGELSIVDPRRSNELSLR